MTFEKFLRNSNIFDTGTLNKFIDDAVVNRKSLYQILSENLDKLRKTEEQLIELYCKFDKKFSVFRSNNRFKANLSFIRELGGINFLMSLNIIPLKLELSEQEDDKLIFLFKYPDNDTTNSKIENIIGNQECVKYLCDTPLWNSIWNLYIEPIEISVKASSMSAVQDIDKMSTSIASEARSLYMKILSNGYNMRASDIHFIPCKENCRVLFRVDGHYIEYTRIPKDILHKIFNILKQEGRVSEKKSYIPIDGKAVALCNQKRIDIRFSIIQSHNGPDINIRFLRNELLTFEELGMSDTNISTYKKILNMPQGLVVQVGPTGSGKTTTLYSGLKYITSTLSNVVAIEDPVEITLDGITQIDVDSSRGNNEHLTFSDALKASLRHDPDIIVVGEMRDTATAQDAIRAATTGHLVLSSLHTNDAISVFERLRNMGIDSYSLGEVLVAVMSQRLVRRLCPYCKEEYVFNVGENESKLWRLKTGKSYKLYRPVGCEKCLNTGYYGRVAINEILEVDSKLRDLIQTHALRSDIESYLTTCINNNSNTYKSMYMDGVRKAIQGITSLEEMYKMALDTTAFKL